MVLRSKNSARFTKFLFWFLLLYIIAALIWWFISLEIQNRKMASLSLINIENKKSALTAQQYEFMVQEIEQTATTNSQKYIGEGVTFLLLILWGAVFLYRSFYRQFRQQLQQQNFMMAVTHELKTPISIATLNLETIIKHDLESVKKTKLLQMTLQELARLNSLTSNILIAAQLDGPRINAIKEELDISALLKECIQNFRARHDDYRLVEYIEEEISLNGDAFLLQLMINNFLDNAIKYSPKEKPITCRLTTQKHKVQLSITDEGVGIADEEKKKVFEKFYRIGNEQTRKTQGTGLGLYLCKKIARYHNADILVTNNNPAGCTFAITFQV